MNEPEGIPERIDDHADEHAPAAASDGTVDQPGGESQGSGESANARAGTGAAPPEPGANGGMDSRPDAGVDPVTELADELGLAPGATDAVDPGQDNGLNS